jgi:hypothetical protein
VLTSKQHLAQGFPSVGLTPRALKSLTRGLASSGAAHGKKPKCKSEVAEFVWSEAFLFTACRRPFSSSLFSHQDTTVSSLASDAPRLENAIGLFVDLYHCEALDSGPLTDDCAGLATFFPLASGFDSTRLVGTRLVGFALLLNDRRLGLVNLRFGEIAIQQENNIWTWKFSKSSLDKPLGYPS